MVIESFREIWNHIINDENLTYNNGRAIYMFTISMNESPRMCRPRHEFWTIYSRTPKVLIPDLFYEIGINGNMYLAEFLMIDPANQNYKNWNRLVTGILDGIETD